MIDEHSTVKGRLIESAMIATDLQAYILLQTGKEHTVTEVRFAGDALHIGDLQMRIRSLMNCTLEACKAMEAVLEHVKNYKEERVSLETLEVWLTEFKQTQKGNGE